MNSREGVLVVVLAWPALMNAEKGCSGATVMIKAGKDGNTIADGDVLRVQELSQTLSQTLPMEKNKNQDTFKKHQLITDLPNETYRNAWHLCTDSTKAEELVRA